MSFSEWVKFKIDHQEDGNSENGEEAEQERTPQNTQKSFGEPELL